MKAAASGVGRKGETLPCGGWAMRRWDSVLQGRGTEIGASAEQKVVETWSALWGWCGSKETAPLGLEGDGGRVLWGTERQWCLTRKGSCRGQPGELSKLPPPCPHFPYLCIFAYTYSAPETQCR